MLETWFRLFIDRRCPSDAASACAAIGNPVFSVS
jgi:hypothetical protein